MQKMLLIFGFFVFSFEAKSIEGSSTLEKLLMEKNPSLSALENDVRSKENILKANYANYYPSLNAVAGWAENRVDNPLDREKGYVGYLEGHFNLFNGLRDSRAISSKEIDLQISKLDYEQLKRDLKVKITEVTGEMIFLHKLQSVLVLEENFTKQQKQMAAKKVSSGLTSSVDNLEFDLREEEIRIQQRQINQQHHEAHQRLIELVGTDIPDAELERLQFTDLNALITVKPYKAEESPANTKSQLLSEQAELERKSVKGEYAPSLDFIYSYGRLTPNEEVPLSMNEANYKLQITIPLFSGFSTKYKENAAISISKNRNSLQLQTNLDTLSLYNSLHEKIKELTDLYNINERKLKTSEIYFNLTVSEYKRGIKNSPDLVGATERWFSAQKRKPEILKDLEITKSRLETITGI